MSSAKGDVIIQAGASKTRSTTVAGADKSYVLFVSCGYAFCSATLIIINKWALLHYPYGANLTAMQFGSSALVAFALGLAGIVEVDGLVKSKVLAFLPAVILFYVSIASNLKLLQVANVDTFIIARSMTPIITNSFEQFYLGSPPPPPKAAGALVLIVVGAIMYGYVEKDSIVTAAFTWALVYIAAMTLDSVLIKKVVTDVKLTRWGMVFYNNFLAFLMFPVGSYVTGDYKSLLDSSSLTLLQDTEVLIPVLASCVMGLAISYFALNCRKALSATTFTVLAVTNKFVTVAINSTVWSHHASNNGIACLLVCIGSGILYAESLKEAKNNEKKMLA
jgi:GDP-mannose transporter